MLHKNLITSLHDVYHLIAEQKFDIAEKLIADLLKKYSKQSVKNQIKLAKVELLLKRKNEKEAIDLVETIISSPRNTINILAHSFCNLATAYLKIDDMVNLEKTLQRIPDHIQNNLKILKTWIEYYIHIGDFENALKESSIFLKRANEASIEEVIECYRFRAKDNKSESQREYYILCAIHFEHRIRFIQFQKQYKLNQEINVSLPSFDEIIDFVNKKKFDIKLKLNYFLNLIEIFNYLPFDQKKIDILTSTITTNLLDLIQSHPSNAEVLYTFAFWKSKIEYQEALSGYNDLLNTFQYHWKGYLRYFYYLSHDLGANEPMLKEATTLLEKIKQLPKNTIPPTNAWYAKLHHLIACAYQQEGYITYYHERQYHLELVRYYDPDYAAAISTQNKDNPDDERKIEQYNEAMRFDEFRFNKNHSNKKVSPKVQLCTDIDNEDFPRLEQGDESSHSPASQTTNLSEEKPYLLALKKPKKIDATISIKKENLLLTTTTTATTTTTTTTNQTTSTLTTSINTCISEQKGIEWSDDFPLEAHLNTKKMEGLNLDLQNSPLSTQPLINTQQVDDWEELVVTPPADKVLSSTQSIKTNLQLQSISETNIKKEHIETLSKKESNTPTSTDLHQFVMNGTFSSKWARQTLKEKIQSLMKEDPRRSYNQYIETLVDIAQELYTQNKDIFNKTDKNKFDLQLELLVKEYVTDLSDNFTASILTKLLAVSDTKSPSVSQQQSVTIQAPNKLSKPTNFFLNPKAVSFVPKALDPYAKSNIPKNQ